MNVPTAFQGEVQLAGWSETHTGGAKVTFWLPDDESLAVFKTLTAKKGNTAGHRFMAVLVEIGDDEQPVEQTQKQPKEPIGALCQWCVLRCNEQDFWAFLNFEFDSYLREKIKSPAMAADFVKYFVGINSRKELDSIDGAKEKFDKLIRIPYQKWLVARGNK